MSGFAQGYVLDGMLVVLCVGRSGKATAANLEGPLRNFATGGSAGPDTWVVRNTFLELSEREVGAPRHETNQRPKRAPRSFCVANPFPLGQSEASSVVIKLPRSRLSYLPSSVWV